MSPTEIFVAVPVIDLAGAAGNETFGLRGNLEEVAHALIAGINSEGGVACRKLQIKVYKVNALDQNEQRARCLEIQRDKPFAVVDMGGYVTPVGRSCFREAKIPYQGPTAPSDDEAAAWNPYLYSVLATSDRQVRNWASEAVARRTFDAKNGFRKLGLFLDECNPKASSDLRRILAENGVGKDKVSVFTMGGCGEIDSPNEISQALLQHRNDQVSHVFLAGNGSNSQNYVRQADGLRWKPIYVTSDFGNQTNPTLAPRWPDGFDGAIAITSMRTGERNSGIPNPIVGKCNDWLKKAGVRPSDNESDQIPISSCDQFRLFAAAANAAGPNLVRTNLIDGLSRVGRFETAMFGDGIYDRRGKVTGGDFIRAIRWLLDCKCWKVIDGDMKAGH